MPGAHFHLQKGQPVIGPLVTHAGDPFGRLPVCDARIGQAAGRQDMRIAARRDPVIGAVFLDRVIGGFVFQRVAPFRPFRRGQGQGFVRHGVQHVHEGHGRDGPGKQVGRHIDRGSDQQSAG